ncbi:terminase [Campylobacter hyointestinalis subsp. hyointestinalis]|uniref:terminase n=1 Tax=Campylobacter hyointestinalis TaxID=198 RepID=UPI000CE3DC39|nr:terminase [Campylobacter hyointestinalis]PPB58756.1 terminase [Campylobacter hyointestinalis subsp. hyointestinalis]TWO19255.1 terminase [Campylobacter hyointestinalis]
MNTLNIAYTNAQKKVFFESNARFKTVAKGRRLGFTRGCANYVIECLLDSSFGIKKALWVDTVNRNIQNYFDIYFMPLLNQIDSSFYKWSKQDKKLSFINGNILHMVGADRPENIEGLGYDLIILNEAGIILKNPKLWDNSISPMLLDNQKSKAIIGGVPKGKNKFFDLVGNSIKGVSGWEHFKFSSFDNPLINKDEIKRLISELGGENSEVVRQEIYGEFVDGSSNLLISYDELIKAFEKHNEFERINAEVWALDVARFGDDKSVLACKNAHNIYKMKSFIKLNTLELANEIQIAYYNAQVKPSVIFVDTTGVGAGVYDFLSNANMPVSEAIMSAKPLSNEYNNKRAEMYFRFSKALKHLNISVTDEFKEALKRQVNTIEYFYNDKDKFQIISKDNIKKLYGSSPDELDALAMLFYDEVDFLPKKQDWSGNGW